MYTCNIALSRRMSNEWAASCLWKSFAKQDHHERLVIISDVIMSDIIMRDVIMTDIIMSDVIMCNIIMSDIIMCDIIMCDIIMSDTIMSDILMCDIIMSDIIMYLKRYRLTLSLQWVASSSMTWSRLKSSSMTSLTRMTSYNDDIHELRPFRQIISWISFLWKRVSSPQVAYIVYLWHISVYISQYSTHRVSSFNVIGQ